MDTPKEESREGELFGELLESLGTAHEAVGDRRLTGFLAMRGRNWSRELMVVGRATNGWQHEEDCWRASDLAHSARRADVIEKVIRSVRTRDGSCPMLWVRNRWRNSGYDAEMRTSYNTARSAFWRVTRAVVGQLNLADVDGPTWPSLLIWTNLYKVSPQDGGNPTSRLCRVQFEHCVRLLSEELSNSKPRRVLVLTGIDWAGPFLERLGVETTPFESGVYVEARGSLRLEGGESPTLFVISKHPQRKKEIALTEEIVRAFTLGV